MTEGLITRQMHMAEPYTTKEDATAQHRRYFAQFVTEDTIAIVVQTIGANRLLTSENRDGCFNDIAISEWDRFSGWTGAGRNGRYGRWALLNARNYRRDLLREANPELSTGVYGSDLLCIAKEAARIWVERQKESHADAPTAWQARL